MHVLIVLLAIYVTLRSGIIFHDLNLYLISLGELVQTSTTTSRKKKTPALAVCEVIEFFI